jgi:hypothetical protein
MLKGTAILAAIYLTMITCYALANPRQNPENIAPYNDHGYIPKGHVWARDTALSFLEIDASGDWIEKNVTNTELLGTSIMEYSMGDLKVTVLHCLNPTADYDVTVELGKDVWSLWVGQDGTVRTQN